MGTSARHFLLVVSRFNIDVRLHSVLSSLALLACSSVDDAASPGAAGSAALSGSGGGGAAATGGSGASSLGGTSGAGAGGIAGAHAGSATAQSGSTHGGMSGGGHGGGGVSGGGSAGSASGSGGSGGATAGASATCDEIRADYAAELAPQLECTPGAGSQCADRVAAAPGCECRVFIEPRDPFAIEHLSNVANAWFDEDCSMPSCPAQCTTASAGTCQADPKSSKGGRCVTP